MHQLRNSFGSFSPLSVSLFLSFCVVLSIPYHLSFVFDFLLTLLLPWLLHVLIPTCSFYFSNVDVFHFHTIQSHPFSGAFFPLLLALFSSLSSLFLLPPTLSHSSTCDCFPSTCHIICLDWTSPLQLSHPSSFIEWPLSLRPSSPCSHSSFPSPLSLSR